MNKNRLTGLRSLSIPVAALLLGTVGGCGISLEQDPATTVKIEIVGVDDDADRESIKEDLTELVDGSSHSMTSFSSGDNMTVSLSPVTDPDTFSKKIEFGTVTSVDDRTIKVEISK